MKTQLEISESLQRCLNNLEAQPQSEGSVSEQLMVLRIVARRLGLYDADDWLALAYVPEPPGVRVLTPIDLAPDESPPAPGGLGPPPIPEPVYGPEYEERGIFGPPPVWLRKSWLGRWVWGPT